MCLCLSSVKSSFKYLQYTAGLVVLNSFSLLFLWKVFLLQLWLIALLGIVVCTGSCCLSKLEKHRSVSLSASASSWEPPCSCIIPSLADHCSLPSFCWESVVTLTGLPLPCELLLPLITLLSFSVFKRVNYDMKRETLSWSYLSLF